MFITCILPLLLRDGRALPVSSSNVTSLLWDTGMLSVVDSTGPEPQSPRTLFGVAWSCTLTVLICAWTSVHPNVPPQAIRSRGWTRTKLMFWTIVAPELVLAWAVRQRAAAKEVKNLYNERKGRENSPRDNVSTDENCRVEMLDYETWSSPSHGWLPTWE